MKPTHDLSPLFRSAIGFDRLFDLLDDAGHGETVGNWPPYDIAKTGENDYRITMAVAGFAENELNVIHQPNMLEVSGEKSDADDTHYLHRGIARRSFRRRFELADHVTVDGARLENGLLSVDLRREIPEEMKPRRIEIEDGPARLEGGSAQPGSGSREIEAEPQAA